MSEPKSFEYPQEYKDGKTIHCERCGSDYTEGQYPFCKGNPSGHGEMHGLDDPLEPYVDIALLDRKDPRCDAVNELGIRGVRITSRSQRREIMKEKELQFGSQKFEDRGRKKYFLT